MKLTDIKGSSNIAAIGYEGGTLAVRFAGGGTYHYADVPADVHTKLMKAESKGSFFHQHVKAKFKGVRQDEKKKDKD